MKKALWFFSGFAFSVVLSKKMTDYFKRECPGYQAAYDQQKAALEAFLNERMTAFALKVLQSTPSEQWPSP